MQNAKCRMQKSGSRSQAERLDCAAMAPHAAIRPSPLSGRCGARVPFPPLDFCILHSAVCFSGMASCFHSSGSPSVTPTGSKAACGFTDETETETETDPTDAAMEADTAFLKQRSEQLYRSARPTSVAPDGPDVRRAARSSSGSRASPWRRGTRRASGSGAPAASRSNWPPPSAWAGCSSRCRFFCIFRKPGAAVTRHVVAVGQMLCSALLIHLSGGRTEMHFHIFGSLAFLAFYRDWRVLVTAIGRRGARPVPARHVLAAVHLRRAGGRRQPTGAGSNTSRWVVFEDIFLIFACIQGNAVMHAVARAAGGTGGLPLQRGARRRRAHRPTRPDQPRPRPPDRRTPAHRAGTARRPERTGKQGARTHRRTRRGQPRAQAPDRRRPQDGGRTRPHRAALPLHDRQRAADRLDRRARRARSTISTAASTSTPA